MVINNTNNMTLTNKIDDHLGWNLSDVKLLPKEVPHQSHHADTVAISLTPVPEHDNGLESQFQSTFINQGEEFKGLNPKFTDVGEEGTSSIESEIEPRFISVIIEGRRISALPVMVANS